MTMGAITLYCTLLCLIYTSHVQSGRIYKLGLLTPLYEDMEFSGKTSAAAMDMAIERINGDPNYNRNGDVQLT